MQLHQIDILNIIDNRLSKRSSVHVSKNFTTILGPGTRVFHATNTADFSTTNPGGISIVVAPHLSHVPVSKHIDPSHLGTHMCIKLHMPIGVIMNIATYFPYPHHLKELPPQSLLNRSTQWLTKAKDNRSPLQYLEQTISNWITEHTLASSSNSVLVSGDFNATWSKNVAFNSIYAWATTNQLCNPFIEHRKQLNYNIHKNKPDQPQKVIYHTLFR
jgi:hypothetical protein